MPVTTITAGPPPAPPGALAMSAAGWNVEAAALVQQLSATQAEVAAMLTDQGTAQRELSDMKAACNSEVGRARGAAQGAGPHARQPRTCARPRAM